MISSMGSETLCTEDEYATVQDIVRRGRMIHNTIIIIMLIMDGDFYIGNTFHIHHEDASNKLNAIDDFLKR